jgi:hypothetical protein
MNDNQKPQAIRALLDGEWDDPALVEVGFLFPGIEENIRYIMDSDR